MLESKVWIGKWFKVREGTLSLHEKRLKLMVDSECIFAASLAEFDKFVWPRHSCGGAVEVWSQGRSYFVSFVPRFAQLNAWYAGIEAGHKWRHELAELPTPVRRPLWPRLFLAFYSLIQAFFYAVSGLMFMSQAIDAANAMWVRCGAGMLVLLLLFMFCYLLWQAVSIPFRRQD